MKLTYIGFFAVLLLVITGCEGTTEPAPEPVAAPEPTPAPVEEPNQEPVTDIELSDSDLAAIDRYKEACANGSLKLCVALERQYGIVMEPDSHDAMEDS